MIIICDCANTKDLTLAIRLLDPFQRKSWPSWWPKTEFMSVGIMNWTGKQLKIEKYITNG